MQQKAYLNYFKWNIGGLLENTSVVHRLWGKAEAQAWGSCRCLKAQALAEQSSLLPLSLLHPLAADCLSPYGTGVLLADNRFSLSLFWKKIAILCLYVYSSSSTIKNPKGSF